MLQAFADVIQLRLQCDQTEQNRTLLLQAGANILYKHKQQVANYKFLQ